jgi:DNA-binding GntR family transcriptional regulator
MTTSITSDGSGLQPELGRLVQRRALRDGVYDAILELLLEGRVKPGASLSIDALARQLGVSPTPVREAMVQLEHTGLVTRAALKGYRVAPPLPAERMSELVDARTILEVAAVRAAVPMSDAALLELKAAHADHVLAADYVRRVRARNDETIWPVVRRYYTADWGFHLVILSHCGNQYLLQLAEFLSPQVHRLRQALGHGLTDMEQAVAEHGDILEAIASGDNERAESAMRAHLLGVRARSLAES